MLSGAVAEAQHAVTAAQREPQTLEGRSYALELGLAYVAAPFAAIAFGAATEPGVGLLAFTAPPLVHVAVGSYGNAVLSTLMIPGSFVGGALLGGAIDRASCSNDEWFCGLGGAILGGMAGYVVWGIADTAFFSRAAPSAPMRGPSLSVGPMLNRNGVGGVLVGAF